MPINKSLYYASKTGIFADAPYHASYEPYPSFGRTSFTYATDPAFGGLREMTDEILMQQGIQAAKTGEAPLGTPGGSGLGPWIIVGVSALALLIFGMTLRQGRE